jgi:type I restriction enzyme, S subunit
VINKNIPEIRFQGFMEDWEERKLGEGALKIGDGLHGTPRYSSNGDIAFINGNNLVSGKIMINSQTKYVTSNQQSQDDKELKQGTILMSINGTIGNLAWYNGEKVMLGKSAAYIEASSFDKNFLYQLLQTSKTKCYFLNNLTGTTIKNLGLKTIRETPTLVPKIDEQKRIGQFFKKLDETIALHQQELTTLKQTKQGFLQKMFPKEGEFVPEIRFLGFTGKWKNCKLNSIVDRLKSYSLSRDVETSEYTGYKYIHYGDIHTKVADVIDESSNLPNIKAGNYELLKKGDLVLADASEDYQGIATPAVITIDMPYKLVSGLHTIALRPKPKQVDSLFLYYLINSPIFKKYGYKAGTGMKVFGISIANLLKFETSFPLLKEQAQIGVFFKQLDDTIALHQRELDALKETKKAFLQKMFV